MSLAEKLARITRAGFTLAIEDDTLRVEPFAKLTDDQRAWLSTNRAEIMAAIKASEVIVNSDGGNDLQPANDARVTFHVPEYAVKSGKRYSFDLEVQTNIQPQPLVKCLDCTHASVDRGIARCEAGVDSGLPIQGFWATNPHRCGQFNQKAHK